MEEEDNSVTLIVANKKSASKGLTGTILLPDCVVSIDHKFENEVTEHPVDGKASVSDHVVNKNVTFTVSGVYNTYSVDKYFNDSVSAKNRIAEAYNKLLYLRDSKVPFRLVSKYAAYNNCVVRSLNIPVAPDDGNTLIFSMEIVQIRLSKDFDEVRLAQVEDVSQPFVDSAQIKTQSGVKSKTKVSTDKTINQASKVINGGG